MNSEICVTIEESNANNKKADKIQQLEEGTELIKEERSRENNVKP